MARKISKRKAIQAAKRQSAADAEARKSRKWPGTRRDDGGGSHAGRVAVIAHHHNSSALAALLLGAGAFKVLVKKDDEK